jgi:hypothetical protein
MEFVVGIIVPLAAFAMIFGIFYIIVTAQNRERMALIEKGADPKLFQSEKVSSKGTILKWGLFLAGIGLGIFFAALLAEAGMNEGAAYPAMICIFGGAGLLLAYRMEQKTN